MVDCFPHSRQPSVCWLSYVSNLLHMSQYCPTLRERVLTAILERATQLDVEVTAAQQLSAGHATAAATANTEAGLVTLLDASVLDSSDAQRLDALLCLLMRYLHGLQQPQQSAAAVGSVSVQSAGGASASSDEVFFSLLRVFSVSILSTHRVQLVPFVLLYVCSLSHTYAESFLRWLLERAFDGGVQPAVRVTCVSYVQSFVARAAYLRHVSVALTFRHMLEWTAQLARYTEEQWSAQFDAAHAALPAVGPLDAPQFSVFYSCFQCVLYMFVYRGKQFEADMDAQMEQPEEAGHEEEEVEEAGLDDAEDEDERQQHSSGTDSSDETHHADRSWRMFQEQQADKSFPAATLPSPALFASPARSRPRYSGSLTRSRLRLLLSDMVLSPLQPLRYCSPVVVQQFSRVARDMDVLNLRPVLRGMRRSAAASAASEPSHTRARRAAAGDVSGIAHSSLNNGSGLLGYTAASESAINSDASDSAQQLQAYFPFDPHFLPHSARLLEPLYTFAPPSTPSPAPTSPLHTSSAGSNKGKRKSAVAKETSALSTAAAHRDGRSVASGGFGGARNALTADSAAADEFAHELGSSSDDSQLDCSSRRKRADRTRRAGRRPPATAASGETAERLSESAFAARKRQPYHVVREQLDRGEEEREESEQAEEEAAENEEAAAALLSYSPGFGPSLAVPATGAVSPYLVAEQRSVSPLTHLSPPVAASSARRSASASLSALSPLPPSALRRLAGGHLTNSASLLSQDGGRGLTPPIVALRSMPAR